MSKLMCRNEERREQVRQQVQLNGLDYLEVGEPEQIEPTWKNQCLLRVYFLGKAPVELDESNVRIEGGRRIRDIQVTDVKVEHFDTVELDDYMEVTVDRPGDFSTYTLRVVERGVEDGKNVWLPHSAFDQRYNSLDFNFKVDCPNELDCKQEKVCPPESLQEPEISYLAKDYASFRQLILDRFSLTMPEWQERHVPDIGMALVEILAYTGDHLSYYQDAVATEAYLHTARQRISVRRHARLVDYVMHEGCNARAWVAVETSSDLPPLSPKDFFFIAGADKALQSTGNVLKEEDLRQVQASQYEVFEPMGTADIQLHQSHNRITFYTWGDKECCLSRGATTATLFGKLIPPEDEQPEKPSCPGKDDQKQEKPQEQMQKVQKAAQQVQQDIEPVAQTSVVPKLYLKAGDILIFEEMKGPKTGHPQDADPRHRHAVRLTKVEAVVDRLDNTPVVDIRWAEEDALPFPLCISSLSQTVSCEVLENVSVARGNIILVDHGRTGKEEDLGAVPLKDEIPQCLSAGRPAETIRIPDYYRPSLASAPLTFSQPLVTDAPASAMLVQDVRQALPGISLVGIQEREEDASEQAIQNDEAAAGEKGEDPAVQAEQKVAKKTGQEQATASSPDSPETGASSAWEARADLLASGPDDLHFVAEMDNDGRAHLRFGDDEFGEQPEVGMHFRAQYRTGNGPAGNVGAGAISRLVQRQGRNLLSGANLTIRNPLPAQGGTAAEPLEEVRLYAPHTFRRELQRAITAEDYASIVEREFKGKVQRVAARLRWNGSWHEVLVAVDPLGKNEADQDLLDAIAARLHRYRRIGHDLVVRSAQQVPLEIGLRVCVLPHYLRGHVKAALLELFSNRILPNGRKGFFHPDNLTFGDGIYVSKLVAAAQGVTGVESVQVTQLRRYKVLSKQEREKIELAQVNGQVEPDQAIVDGILPLAPFEVARLDNDPSFPENGILNLDMRGGR